MALFGLLVLLLPAHAQQAAAGEAIVSERLTVADAFSTHVGIDLLATLTPTEGDREALAAQAARANIAEGLRRISALEAGVPTP